MRQVTRKGLITVAAAGGVLALSGGTALADATADGGAEHSPGVGSGNNVQVPVHVPVNVCGNTVNVVGLLNPAIGNTCVNDSGHGEGHGKKGHGEKEQAEKEHDAKGGGHGGGHQSGGSTAEGGTAHSPGVLSGNNVQVPVHVPVNACGNSIDVIGVLNPTAGNECVNVAGSTEHEHEQEETEKSKEETDDPKGKSGAPETQTVAQPELAQTGAGYELETAMGMGASMLLGGTVLYRRARAAQR